MSGRLPGKGDRMLKHAIGSKNGAWRLGSRCESGDAPHPASIAVAADPASEFRNVDRVTADAAPRS